MTQASEYAQIEGRQTATFNPLPPKGFSSSQLSSLGSVPLFGSAGDPAQRTHLQYRSLAVEQAPEEPDTSVGVERAPLCSGALDLSMTRGRKRTDYIH